MADLSEALDKLKQMMATDEGQSKIQNVLSGLNSGGVDTSNLGNMLGNFANQNSDSSEPSGGLDMDTMLKMQKMMSMMNSGGGNSNRHATMLNSLKPYLSDGRKGKLDMVSKLMGLAKFAPLMKEL